MRPRYSNGNRLTLLRNGAEFFPALQNAIDEATSEVRFESYIFANDESGRRIARALAAAARRGVKVYVVVDGFGADNFRHDFADDLIRDGVEVQIYRPEIARLRMRRQRLRRMHRKLACIDGRIAFVGGINIIDDISEAGQKEPRLDYCVRVEGPLLLRIRDTMTHLWETLRWAQLRRRERNKRSNHQRQPHCGDVRATLLVRDNIRHRHEIEEAYLDAIETAQEEILIANAYFLPGRRFRQALIAAAGRGVRVTVLLQGKLDHPLQHFATLALYGQMLDAGIRIFEYRKSYLHAKVAVIDADWATVGSSNIDPFSLLLAREANVLARNTAFATQLRQQLFADMREGAVEIAAQAYRPLYLRITAWLAYGLVRALIGLAGYSHHH